MSGSPEKKRATVPPNSHGACGATWTGTTDSHCSGCCRTFSAPGLFDRHRTARGERGTCLDPATLDGLEFRDGMWRGPAMTEDVIARRNAA